MRLRVTPVPIPNTMVKTQAADGTSLETVRESRWPPGYKKLKNTKQIRCKCSGDSYRYRQEMSNNLSVPTLSARKCCYDSWFYQWSESWKDSTIWWLIKQSNAYIAPQELRSFGRVQARYETEYFTAYECKHSMQKIFVSQCTLKTAYKKYR